MTSRAPLVVMQLTPDLEVGGAQETVCTLAKYLPRTGCAVVVCTFRDGPLRHDLERLGVPVEVLPGRRHSVVSLPFFLLEMARRRRALLQLIAKHHVDVVQTQALGTLDFLVMTLRLSARVQVWWTIQNANFLVRREHLPRHRWLLGPKRRAHRGLYRLGARWVNGVIAVSDETAIALRRVVGGAGDRISVVCNAVDVERYPAPVEREDVRARLGFGADEHVMIMVGTFKRQKGHTHLIEAAASVVDRFPDLHIVLVGDGELAEEIKGRLRAFGLDRRVHLLGTRRDVPELLAASDSFVLPSLWEGLPVALVEAMASDLPVIATAVSGTSQVMIDGETGWLVPPGDGQALAAAMVDLLSDLGKARTMAANARQRAGAFSARGQAEQLAGLFSGTLGPRRHAPSLFAQRRAS